MKGIYRRYFRVTEGPLVAAVKEATAINEQAKKEYQPILESIGAKSTQWYQQDNRLVGLMFEKEPDKSLFKEKKRGGWWPKSNSKKGKEIATKLAAVKTADVSKSLKVVGLYGGNPVLFGNGRAYYSTLTTIPSDPLVIFVSVPWYDENPETLEKCKEDRAKGSHRSSNLDHILWEPTVDMAPVKKWEVDKAIDDWNMSVRAEG